MTEIVKKKNDEQQLAEWHPLRAFRDLFRWEAKKIPISTGGAKS